MRIQQKKPFEIGYNSITEIDGKHSEMLMDFGILKLDDQLQYSDSMMLERVILLIYGEIEVTFDGKAYHAKRDSFLDDDFWCVNIPEGMEVKIKGISDDSEVAIVKAENHNQFIPTVRTKKNSVIETRGQGYMNEAGTRIVKTMADHKLAPESTIMIGEDVHYPGKWSGFPSHSHEQPEIYFYKFYPENGFGLLKLGDEGVLLEHNDTITIDPDLVHPQVAAPGYAMYYIWIIRHLEGNPYLGPTFEEEHLWVEKPGAKYWPDI